MQSFEYNRLKKGELHARTHARAKPQMNTEMMHSTFEELIQSCVLIQHGGRIVLFSEIFSPSHCCIAHIPVGAGG